MEDYALDRKDRIRGSILQLDKKIAFMKRHTDCENPMIGLSSKKIVARNFEYPETGIKYHSDTGNIKRSSYFFDEGENPLFAGQSGLILETVTLCPTSTNGLLSYTWRIHSVVSTSSCPVFLTNEMSGWLKLYRVIAKAEIGRSSCFFS